MSDNRYNGWTNRETWNVALWIGNDEGMYLEVRQLALTAAECGDDVYDLAKVIESYIEDVAEMVCPGVIEGASFVSDMFGYALAGVDWQEIAENKLRDAVESLSEA